MHMVSFEQIPAWVFLIHLFFYAGFYCIIGKQAGRKTDRQTKGGKQYEGVRESQA